MEEIVDIAMPFLLQSWYKTRESFYTKHYKTLQNTYNKSVPCHTFRYGRKNSSVNKFLSISKQELNPNQKYSSNHHYQVCLK